MRYFIISFSVLFLLLIPHSSFAGDAGDETATRIGVSALEMGAGIMPHDFGFDNQYFYGGLQWSLDNSHLNAVHTGVGTSISGEFLFIDLNLGHRWYIGYCTHYFGFLVGIGAGGGSDGPLALASIGLAYYFEGFFVRVSKPFMIYFPDYNMRYKMTGSLTFGLPF